MSKDNVVQFPAGNIRNPIAAGEDDNIDLMTRYCMSEIISVLAEQDIYINSIDDKLAEDLGVVLNLLNASVGRYYGKKHFLHETMDELCNVIKELKRENDYR
jgi:hypothetical protein